MAIDQKLVKLHQDALSEFDRIQETVRDERMQCLEDRRFYSIAGASWEGNLGDQFENKPKFEVNKIHLAVIRIINEYRNNRFDVTFSAKDGSKDENADFCAGLYRADIEDSQADEALDNAFEEAVGGGFGAIRLRNVYEDEEDEDDDRQRIVFEPIYDADSSVFFSLDAKRQDKSDAKACYVLTAMDVEAYKNEYQDDPATWPKDINQTQFDWHTPDVVYVCAYYKVEMAPDIVYTYRALDGSESKHYKSEFDKDPEYKTELLETGHILVKEKRIKRRRVRKYLMSGGGVIEDYGYIAGKHIPVIPCYGKRWFIDNIERCMGHVRLAKDAQRLKNMQLSKLGEISALSAIEKPIFVTEQIRGHELLWAEDNVKAYPFLVINSITGANGETVPTGPVGKQSPPQIPPAMAALLQLTESDIADILGNQQQADKMVSNISGTAVDMIQTRIDAQAYIYISNHAKMLKRAGEVWLSMAKEIYIEPGRKVKVIDDQDSASSAELLSPLVNNKTGAIDYTNDISGAKFDVKVNIGPSSSSRRQSTLKSLINMIQISDDPETRQVLTSMAMLNMEGEGIQNVRDYFRKKLVRIGVIKPTDEEMAEMQQQAQNAQPDPNAVFLQAAAEEAMAKATQARASVIKTMADAELSRAKTVETLEKTTRDNDMAEYDAMKSAKELWRDGSVN